MPIRTIFAGMQRFKRKKQDLHVKALSKLMIDIFELNIYKYMDMLVHHFPVPQGLNRPLLIFKPTIYASLGVSSKPRCVPPRPGSFSRRHLSSMLQRSPMFAPHLTFKVRCPPMDSLMVLPSTHLRLLLALSTTLRSAAQSCTQMGLSTIAMVSGLGNKIIWFLERCGRLLTQHIQ